MFLVIFGCYGILNTLTETAVSSPVRRALIIIQIKCVALN